MEDRNLIDSGSIAFSAGDNLTTEKKTSAFKVYSTENDVEYALVIDKPTENTAGNLTVYVYNQVKVDGTNSRDTLFTTHTIEKITDAGTYRQFSIGKGVGIGEGTIKIGAKFTTDSGAVTIYYKLFRL